MHKFNMLKYGGGQHLTLLRRIAQKAVRYDTQSDCRRAEEVQNHGQFKFWFPGISVCGRNRIRNGGFLLCKSSRDKQTLYPCRYKILYFSRQRCLYLCRIARTLWFRHACGGCNHLAFLMLRLKSMAVWNGQPMMKSLAHGTRKKSP